MTIAVMYAAQAVVKIKPEKILGSNGNRTRPNPAITGAVLSPVSYPSQQGDGHS